MKTEIIRSKEPKCKEISLPMNIIQTKSYDENWINIKEIRTFLESKTNVILNKAFNRNGGFGVIYSVKDDVKKVMKITSFRKYLEMYKSLEKKEDYIDDSLYNNNIQKFLNEGYIHVKMNGKDGFPETYDVFSIKITNAGKIVDVLLCIKMKKYDEVDAKAFKKMCERNVLNMASCILDSLQEAHEVELVHRDIKHQNILYDAGQNKYILIDWGIAKIFKQATTIIGHAFSDAYIAPERAYYYVGIRESNSDRDPRSDIYSIGVVLYYWANDCDLTPTSPVHGDTDCDGERKYINILKPDYTKLKKGSDGYIKIMKRALNKDPEKRFQSASEMKAAIDEYIRVQDSQTEEECLVPDALKERLKFIANINGSKYEEEVEKFLKFQDYILTCTDLPFVYGQGTEDKGLVFLYSSHMSELLLTIEREGTSEKNEILAMYYADMLYGWKTIVKKTIDDWEKTRNQNNDLKKTHKNKKKNKIWIWMVIIFVLLFGGIYSNFDKLPHSASDNGKDINNELKTDKISENVIWEQFVKQTYEKSKEETRLNGANAKNKMSVGSTLPSSIAHGQTKNVKFEIYTESIPTEIILYGLNDRNIQHFFDISNENLNNGVFSFNYILDAGKDDVPNAGRYRVRLYVQYADESGNTELGKVFENYYLDTYIDVQEDVEKVVTTKQPLSQTNHNTNISAKDFPNNNNQTITKKSDNTSTIVSNDEKNGSTNSVVQPVELVETTTDNIEASCPVCDSKFHTEHPQGQAPDIPMDFE